MSERQPSGSLRCGSSQRRNGSRACTTPEDFTDVQLKTVDRLGLGSSFLVAGLKYCINAMCGWDGCLLD